MRCCFGHMELPLLHTGKTSCVVLSFRSNGFVSILFVWLSLVSSNVLCLSRFSWFSVRVQTGVVDSMWSEISKDWPDDPASRCSESEPLLMFKTIATFSTSCIVLCWKMSHEPLCFHAVNQRMHVNYDTLTVCCFLCFLCLSLCDNSLREFPLQQNNALCLGMDCNAFVHAVQNCRRICLWCLEWGPQELNSNAMFFDARHLQHGGSSFRSTAKNYQLQKVHPYV